MFVKLYEREGVQVAVFKDTDSDAESAVTVMFEISGAYAKQTFTCAENTEECQRELFDKVTEEIAFSIRDELAARWEEATS